MKPLIIIPARAGSKGLPAKNIKLLNKKPLIQYTIDCALQLFDSSHICISTDSDQIKKISEQSGLNVPFIRPKHLASDTSSSFDVINHAFKFWSEQFYTPDYIVLLQPTSPLRKPNHLKEALNLFLLKEKSVVSVKHTKSNPYFNLFEEDKNGLLRQSKISTFTRRQDCPEVFEVNGAIYIDFAATLVKNGNFFKEGFCKYLMDEKSSLDIDTLKDFQLCELALSNQLHF